ncbi:MAG: hypothetical protein BWY76_03193 [bacterium ADurb.Bin429]|nr:MAG: hypothetical protein BWY76_03193 [bacterium ADurb.Bin429]
MPRMVIAAVAGSAVWNSRRRGVGAASAMKAQAAKVLVNTSTNSVVQRITWYGVPVSRCSGAISSGRMSWTVKRNKKACLARPVPRARAHRMPARASATAHAVSSQPKKNG